MEKLSAKKLLELYFLFTSYRDKECDGHAEMSVQDFYLKRCGNGK